MADSRNTSVSIGLLDDPVQNLGVAMPSAYIVSGYPIGDEHKNIGKVYMQSPFRVRRFENNLIRLFPGTLLSV